MKIVGKYIEKFNDITGQKLSCGDIYLSDGLLVHMRKRHLDEICYMPYIPEILAMPDYVGRNPKEPDSVELVKVIERNMMVCVKLDKKNAYMYVASMFSISDSKLETRIASGRLKKFY